MARSTQQLRDLWHPGCKAKGSVFLQAYLALDLAFHRHNYRPRAGVTGAYNCRAITGGTLWSLHAYGPGALFTFWTGVVVTMALAVDVNWDRNPYGPYLVTDMPREMIAEILAIRTVDGVPVFRWGGYYTGNKDAMHFEIVASPAELARGIAGGMGEDDMFTDDDRAMLVNTSNRVTNLETVARIWRGELPDTVLDVDDLFDVAKKTRDAVAAIGRQIAALPAGGSATLDPVAVAKAIVDALPIDLAARIASGVFDLIRRQWLK